MAILWQFLRMKNVNESETPEGGSALILKGSIITVVIHANLHLKTRLILSSHQIIYHSLAMRAAANKPNISIVAVNDPFIPVDYMEHMYKYDTVRRRAPGNVTHDAEANKSQLMERPQGFRRDGPQ